MDGEIIKHEYYLKQGHVYCPTEPTLIYTVTGSGIAVTFFDKAKKRGVMCHFVFPKIRKGYKSTPLFAAPAIISSLKILADMGSKRNDIECQVFGGAENKESEYHISNLNRDNIESAESIIADQGLTVSSRDVGGNRGRKIIFNAETGETMVMKVNKIRKNDWYPREL